MTEEDKSRGIQKPRRLEVVCHKGANEYAPENTIAAAQLAISWGADYVEVDVSKSADGVLYVFHGPNVNRTTNHAKIGTSFQDLMSHEIDTLDAGSWFHPRFASERVPRLDMFLRFVKGKAKVFLDVKDGTPQELLRAVQETKMKHNCFFWSRSDDWAMQLRALDASIPIKINANAITDLKRAKDVFGATIIEVRTRDLNDVLVNTCHALGMRLMVFEPLKNPSNYRVIMTSGADMVNLDHADLWFQLLLAQKVENQCVIPESH